MATPIPENRARFTFAEIAEALGLPTPEDGARVAFGVATDSRVDLTGKVFVALVGERFDGHEHVLQALERGAVAVVVERPVEVSVPAIAAVPTFVVASTLDALGQLARAHLRRCDAKVVAIAGAAGKTSTRAATQALLEQELGEALLCTPGNLNNRIGVPMVALQVNATHRVVVLEVGTNFPGEVRALTQIVEPDVAVLTLIALEHTEGLGDLDGVEREESEILATGPLVAIGNGDDERVRRCVLGGRASRALLYGFSDDCDYRVLEHRFQGSKTWVRYRTPAGEFALELPWLPKTAVLAMMAGLATSEVVLGRSLPAANLARAASSSTWRVPGRMIPTTLGNGILILDDSYNSNPASLRAAVQTARDVALDRSARLHLVLGEMRELGALSEQQHRELGSELSQLDLRSLTAVSGDARHFSSGEPGGRHDAFFERSVDAIEHVRALLEPGAVVLVKGSRGTRTDLIVNALVSGQLSGEPGDEGASF